MISKRCMIPLANTVFFKMYIAWAYEEICPFLLVTFYPIELFKFIWELLCDKIFHQECVPQGAILSTTLFNVKISDVGELALVITPVCTSIHYPLMCDYTFNCVWNVMFSVLSVLQGCIFILPFYYTTLILSCCEIFLMPSVLCVIVSSIISCNDLYQDFIIMFVWYFVSRNSTSV